VLQQVNENITKVGYVKEYPDNPHTKNIPEFTGICHDT
jgi:hypothetical protein